MVRSLTFELAKAARDAAQAALDVIRQQKEELVKLVAGGLSSPLLETGSFRRHLVPRTTSP